MGAVVYSGLQAEHNATAAPGVKPVGIMIVTRLKAQADEVVSDINAYVGRHVAVADHTDSRATPEQLHESDIVVITHAAYTRAKETLSGVNADRWHRLTRWRGGRRLLTIIDEALANVVEHTQLKRDELSRVIGRITHESAYLMRSRLMRWRHFASACFSKQVLTMASVSAHRSHGKQQVV